MEHDASHIMLITMVVAISAGIMLIVMAQRLNMSAIVLLLLGGMALGPEGLGFVQTETLGDGLPVIVSLAVGLILFEGGLTLDLRGYRSASAMIRRLLSVGVLVTWGSISLLLWIIFQFSPAFCLLSASLLIVTGPTVITPLLKRIKVKENLHGILHWEGVLIDPIGVFIAILCYEWMGDLSGEMALARFVLRFAWGLALGVGGGLVIYQLIRLRVVSDDLLNAFVLGSAVMIFGLAESLFSESGLLAVTVAGFVLGFKNPIELRGMRRFKAEITDLMIGLLFILLSARLELQQFAEFGWKMLLAVAGVLIVARPLNVLLSAWGLGLSWREKVFLSWVAPRGIVAASMGALFALNLRHRGVEHAAFIETFTYSVIVTTVLLQGFTAGPLARLLKLRRSQPTGWMIVGAHAFGRRLAQFISQVGGLPVVLIDTNSRAVADACDEGLVALRVDARDLKLESHQAIQPMGHLLALTDNEDLNVLLCQQWADVFGSDHTYCWCSVKRHNRDFPGRVAWSGLPKPSVLSGEMERAETILIHLTNPQNDPDHSARPLLISANESISLTADLNNVKEGSQVLFLQREADYLSASLHPECVVRITENRPDKILDALVTRLSNLVPILSHDEILGNLLAREQAFSSALGHGVALSHTYCEGMDFRVCAIAQVPNGADFKALDGEPVRLVFLLISPANNTEGHLETLAEIARLVSNAEIREKLMTAEVPDDVLKIVRGFAV